MTATTLARQRAPRSSQNSIRLPVMGMTCSTCVAQIERASRTLPGVQDASVNLAAEAVSVTASPDVTTDVVAQAVRQAGYDVVEEEVVLQVSGMTCASCVARVERALSNVSGVS